VRKWCAYILYRVRDQTHTRTYAEAEGCDLSRLNFIEADAHEMQATAGYDAVIMHTLLSHTTDPSSVLAAARKQAKVHSSK
jgi:2-polyprenyl-3-methyl-5-hydroxy-6-metoxy-1,4-benzoquinol methylase